MSFKNEITWMITESIPMLGPLPGCIEYMLLLRLAWATWERDPGTIEDAGPLQIVVIAFNLHQSASNYMSSTIGGGFSKVTSITFPTATTKGEQVVSKIGLVGKTMIGEVRKYVLKSKP